MEPCNIYKIINISEFIIGSVSNINTNIPNLTFVLNGSENIPTNFEGMQNIKFYQKDQILLEFDYNFSNNTMLDFTNMSIFNASNSSLGGFIVGGIDLTKFGYQKIVYLERINQNENGLCIKDEEIDWIDNITDTCDGTNEFKVECDGSIQRSYICTYNSSENLYKITGLSHSGITQFSYAQPSSNGGSSSGGGSSGGGGGGGSSGGGGGGGGGAAGFVCNHDWQCSDWSECINGQQSRQCSFVKVPQHVQDAECSDISKTPITTQKCEVKREAIPNNSETSNNNTQTKSIKTNQASLSKQPNNQENKKEFFDVLTGAVTALNSNPKAMNEIKTILWISGALVVLGTFFYYRFKIKKKT